MQKKYITYLNHWIYENRRKPLLLRGARQVGKSTLVRQFAKGRGLRHYEVNLEKHPTLDQTFATLDVNIILNTLEALLKTDIPRDATSLLFLDEIQATPQAIAALRYFFEELPQLPVVAAGSLLEFALAEHSFSMPVGRISYLYVEPVSFGDFLAAANETWVLSKLEQYTLGEPWDLQLHQQVTKLYHRYCEVGGMPEAIAAHLAGASRKKVAEIHEQISTTYQDDFTKYAKRARINSLRLTYERLPAQIGCKMIYANLSKEFRSNVVAETLQMLEYARIIRRVVHTQASGLPIASFSVPDVFKTYWLDIGLLKQRSRLPEDDEGPLAEQFVAQHLHCLFELYEKSQLFYWLRQGKSTNAEVDFVTQIGSDIVPIEVKSGKIGSLRSLHQFIAEHQSKSAIRLNLQPPSLQNIKSDVRVGHQVKTIEFRLLSLPLYMTEWLRALYDVGRAAKI